MQPYDKRESRALQVQGSLILLSSLWGNVLLHLPGHNLPCWYLQLTFVVQEHVGITYELPPLGCSALIALLQTPLSSLALQVPLWFVYETYLTLTL